LDPPWRIGLTGDHAEVARIGQREARIGEVHVIVHVEEVEGEDEVRRLGDRRLLPDGEIDVPAREAAKRIGATRPSILADQDASEAVEDLLRIGEEIQPGPSARRVAIGPDVV